MELVDLLTEAPLIRFTISLNTLGQVVADVQKVPDSKFKEALESWNLDYENTNKLVCLLKVANTLFVDALEELENYMQNVN